MFVPQGNQMQVIPPSDRLLRAIAATRPGVCYTIRSTARAAEESAGNISSAVVSKRPTDIWEKE